MTLWGIIKGLLVQEETDRTKQLSVEVDASATTATRTTLRSSQTADRTLDLPDADDTLVGKATTDILTNKSIDSDNNTITNIVTADLKAGVLVTDVSTASADTELPSALAVKTALEAQNEADEITFDPSSSSLTQTNVQAAMDESTGRLDTAETNIGNNATAISDHIADASAAHAASAVSNTPSGNLAATDMQGAVNELQGDIDSINTTVSGKADTDLNNLASVDLNQNLTTTKASALQLSHTTVNQDVDVLTANNGAGDSGDINLTPGTATGTRGDINLLGEQKSTVNINSPIWWATSGIPGIALDLTTTAATNAFAAAIVAEGSVNDADFFIQTQDQDAGTAGSANMYITTGWNSNTGSTGNLELYTGNQSGASGNTGAFSFETGQSSNGNSGSVNTKTGQANNGTSGSYSISTGNSTAGTTGDINITTGTTAGTRGGVIFNTNKIDMTGSTELDVTGITVTGLSAGGDAWSDPVDANIVPDGVGTRSLGSFTNRMNQVIADSFWVKDSTAQLNFLDLSDQNIGRIHANSSTTSPGGETGQLAIRTAQGVTNGIAIYTDNDGTADANPTRNVKIETGNKNAGTGNSGNLELRTGTSVGGSRGDILLTGNKIDLTNSTELDVTGITVTGLPTGGATTELDNLGTTAINADLNFPFGGGNTINLDNDVFITGRNSANTADRNLIKVGGALQGDHLVVGTDLLPDSNETRSFGNTAYTWGQGHFNVLRVRDTSTEYASLGALSTGFTTPSGRTIQGYLFGGSTNTNFGILSYNTSGGSANTAGIFVETGDNTGNGAGNTGELTFITGDKSAVGASTGDTGNITIATGNNNLTGTADSGSISISTGTVNGAGSGTRGDVSIDTEKLDVSNVSEGVGLPVWKKVTVAATAFTAASTSEDIELLSLPAGAAIHSVVIKHSARFDENGNTAFTLSVGISGDLTKYASAFDVWQNPGNTIAQTTSVFDVEDFGSATSIRLAAVSTGQTVDNVTLGSVDVYVLMSTLPV